MLILKYFSVFTEWDEVFVLDLWADTPQKGESLGNIFYQRFVFKIKWEVVLVLDQGEDISRKGE